MLCIHGGGTKNFIIGMQKVLARKLAENGLNYS